ncbi:MAG: S8 family serine peptidase [Acidobacteriota bacterium]|nr:S8 family serine peptidase [Acidobacteriota bacterium]
MQHIKLFSLGVLLPGLLLASFLPLSAQELSSSALQQIKDVLTIKKSLTTAQQKQSSDLVFAAMHARGQSSGTIPESSILRANTSSDGSVLVDMRVNAVDAVTQRILTAGGSIVHSSAIDNEIRAHVPLLSLDSVAALPDVRWIRSADRGHTNGIASSHMHLSPFVGAVTSQGYITHTANQSVGLGFNGAGVNVGVLSDSASPARVAALMASGDLPPDTTVVPGQDGADQSGYTDEGTAMMEIVHDLAPGAKLFFATANTGQSNFASNIRRLRFAYHCDIIVDDYTYFLEGAFQDDVIARAVNNVVADGALYFSSAANSGNLTSGTSGTWEGDFKNGGDAGSVIDGVEGGRVLIHNFASSSNPQLYDVLTTPSGFITLKWSDPLGSSANDYDLFVLDSTGTIIKAFSADPQNGTQDPVEYVYEGQNCGTSTASGYCSAIGDRIVAVLFNGTDRALRFDTNRARLLIGTDGATFGHNAGLNTISMAATYWNSARTGTHPFTGAANPIEPFSSDGPRKIFYNPNGTPITSGNFLFGTNGGRTLQKPDATATDGVFTHTPGFLPFFGTSAAAPHAAAIAALVKSANPKLTNAEIKRILITTTVDNMAPGVDRDSGYGILMALPAVIKSLNP